MVDDSYTKLLLHFNDPDNLFKDEAGHTVTSAGYPVISQTVKKFGGGAISLPTGSYLTLPTGLEELQIGSGPFTIDTWFYLVNTDPAVLFGTANGSNAGFIVGNWGGLLRLYFAGGTVITAETPMLNEWHHIAVVGESTAIKFYLDGHLLGSRTGAYSYGPFVIGVNTADYSTGNKKIDEFRFSKGIARWLADFTPSMTEYSAALDGNVVLSFPLTNFTSTPSASEIHWGAITPDGTSVQIYTKVSATQPSVNEYLEGTVSGGAIQELTGDLSALTLWVLIKLHTNIYPGVLPFLTSFGYSITP